MVGGGQRSQVRGQKKVRGLGGRGYQKNTVLKLLTSGVLGPLPPRADKIKVGAKRQCKIKENS
jgi:hypothetical protein